MLEAGAPYLQKPITTRALTLKVRAVLDAEPTLARIDAAKSAILSAQDKGRLVQLGLDRILAEMNSIIAMLRPAGTAPKG